MCHAGETEGACPALLTTRLDRMQLYCNEVVYCLTAVDAARKRIRGIVCMIIG
jgi:hypothetical protein